jgi:hypothetical protein
MFQMEASIMEKAMKKRRAVNLVSGGTACAIMGLFALLLLPATAVQAQSEVAIVAGKTYGEWSARWWQWAYDNGFPTGTEAFGSGPVDCSAGQSGAVWFLGGSTGGAVSRQCQIKSGKYLFFPLVNIALFNPDPICGPDNTCDVTEKRSITSGILDGAQPGADLNNDGMPDPTYACRLRADVDGIQAIFVDYPTVRTQSPPFALQGDPETVSDGYWVMLPPLSRGEHEIHFTGALCNLSAPPTANPFFAVDVTYSVTVGH